MSIATLVYRARPSLSACGRSSIDHSYTYPKQSIYNIGKQASIDALTFPEVVCEEANTLTAANPPYTSRTVNPAFLSIDVAIADLYPETQNATYSVDLCTCVCVCVCVV